MCYSCEACELTALTIPMLAVAAALLILSNDAERLICGFNSFSEAPAGFSFLGFYDNKCSNSTSCTSITLLLYTISILLYTISILPYYYTTVKST